MFFQTVVIGALAALAAAGGTSRLESFLKKNPSPSNITVGDGHGIDPTVEVKRGLGNAVLGNRCDHDIWVWSVDGKGSSDAIKVPARTQYREPFRTPCEGCGVVLKVSNTPDLQGGHQTQFEYAISNGQLYYDISFVDCAQGEGADNCPGHHNGVGIDSPEKACGTVTCDKDSYCPTQAYYVDQPLIKLGIAEPVFGCGGAGTGMDLYFKMCNSMAPLKRSVAGRLEVEGMA